MRRNWSIAKFHYESLVYIQNIENKNDCVKKKISLDKTILGKESKFADVQL